MCYAGVQKLKSFHPCYITSRALAIFTANNLSRLHSLVTPTQIAEGKKLVEPAEVSNKEEDEAYFLDQQYPGLYDNEFWNVLSAISTYLKLHIRIKIQ
jgi:hypothetical protein